MFYLVVMFCGVSVKQCAPVAIPQGFATYAACTHAGATSSNNPDNKNYLPEYICVEHPPEAPAPG